MGTDSTLKPLAVCRFQWLDGPLTLAAESGAWLLLENANMCSPAVLDRLNSLLEPQGSLLLNEAGSLGGSPRVLRPHGGFRVFMSVNPARGALSQAMRNRSIELFLPAQGDRPHTLNSAPNSVS